MIVWVVYRMAVVVTDFCDVNQIYSSDYRKVSHLALIQMTVMGCRGG